MPILYSKTCIIWHALGEILCRNGQSVGLHSAKNIEMVKGEWNLTSVIGLHKCRISFYCAKKVVLRKYYDEKVWLRKLYFDNFLRVYFSSPASSYWGLHFFSFFLYYNNNHWVTMIFFLFLVLKSCLKYKTLG